MDGFMVQISVRPTDQGRIAPAHTAIELTSRTPGSLFAQMLHRQHRVSVRRFCGSMHRLQNGDKRVLSYKNPAQQTGLCDVARHEGIQGPQPLQQLCGHGG